MTQAPELAMRIAHAAGFDVASLADNRAGRLSSVQARLVMVKRKKGRGTTIGLGCTVMILAGIVGVLLVMRVLGLATPFGARHGLSMAEDTIWTGFAVVVVIAVAGFAVWNAAFGGTGAEKDVDVGRVDVLEGIGARGPAQVPNRYVTWSCTVAGRSFTIPYAAWSVFEDGRTYRVYYLPRSGTLVNVEVLR